MWQGNRAYIRVVKAVSVPSWASWAHLIWKLRDTKQSTQLFWIWESWTHKSFLHRSPSFISVLQVKCPVLETVDFTTCYGPTGLLPKASLEEEQEKYIGVRWVIEPIDCYSQPDFTEKTQSSLLLRKQSRLRTEALGKSTSFDFWQLFSSSYYMWQIQTWRVKAVFLPKNSQSPKQRPKKHRETHYSLQHATGNSPKPLHKPKIWEDCASP